jgi:flagellar protein FlgJ
MKINPTMPGAEAFLVNKSQKEAELQSPEFKKALDKAISNKDDQKLKDACKQFESLFLYQMLQKMRDTVPTGGFIGDSQGEKIFRSLLDEEMTKEMSNAGGLGLAEMLYQQMKPAAPKAKIDTEV